MSGALPSARAASPAGLSPCGSSRSGITNAEVWGSLYRNSSESITAGDRKYYEHHERGSLMLAAAVERYQWGWR